MRSRVMPGSFVTMDRRVAVRRLNNVDLPTLGRPTITMDGSLGVMATHGYMRASNINMVPFSAALTPNSAAHSVERRYPRACVTLDFQFRRSDNRHLNTAKSGC